MIHKTKEGETVRFGINYWFPKNNRTLLRLIVSIPFWANYSTYEDFDSGNTVKGWRFRTIVFRFRIRNMAQEWEKIPPKYIFEKNVWWKNGKQLLIETMEQKEDRGLFSVPVTTR